MTPAFIISLVALGLTGAGILVQLGRVLSTVEATLATLKEIREEQRQQRDALETLRREAAVRDSSHDHLNDLIATHAGAIARVEERLGRIDATPHHGVPIGKPLR